MKNKKDLSIKRLIIVVFILAMLISLTGIGYLIFTRWFSSAGQTMEGIAGSINENVYNRIYSFMRTPDHINEVNRKTIENGILDLSDEKLRDKFFVGVLSSCSDEIYSFSYGTSDGEYYGARRNENGTVEIMRNNASTGGESWYYSVDEDMTAGELVVKAGCFDPRSRSWYRAAVEAQGPALSPVYKHFVMDDLAISAAWPVYDGGGKLQGVLGTHMLLSGIGAFLENTIQGFNGYAIIVERDSGEMIANSTGADNFTVLEDGSLKRYRIGEAGSSDMGKAYEYYRANGMSDFIYEGAKDRLYVNVREIQVRGMDWIVMTAIPDGLLMDNVVKSIHLTVLIIVVTLLAAGFVFYAVTDRLLKPVNSLLQVSEALSSGDLSKRVVISRNDEIGCISKSFNRVADKMQFLINNLEANVSERTEQLHYLSMHDSLTGLHNRRCFEENRSRIDVSDNLPLSVIFADINGLKMTNDIFGHAAGDELIRKSSEILVQSCRDKDIIARIGGDEFIVLLPRTDEEIAGRIISRIRSGFANARVAAIKCSMSLGSDTKWRMDQSLEEVMANAENAMYKDKTMNRKTVNRDIIDTIVETLDAKSSSEKRHSIAVSELCGRVGAALKLPEAKINKLERAGYLHDIGKIIFDESFLKKEAYTEEEHEKMRQHAVVGYRILNLFDETLDLAEFVYCHHERWDGKGYPRGLYGEQIPKIARIISIVETYERVLSRGELSAEERKRAAIEVIRAGAGNQFDPQIAEAFIRIIDEGSI